MNDINREITRIIETVIEHSMTEIGHEHMSITKTEVLGKSRKENAIRVRCLVTHFLFKHGLSLTTIGMILGKSVQAIRNKLAMHDDYYRQSAILGLYTHKSHES